MQEGAGMQEGADMHNEEMTGSVTRRGAVAESTELPAQAADAGGRGVSRVGYAPIVRLDTARREIELCATSEAVDSYGTIFDYTASKEAFARWIGNVREMHERKAVGRRVGVRFDDAARKVFVTIRISRGAEDTWQKVLDGTLRGASIGASNVQWQPQVPDGSGRSVMKATAYQLVELSLVDHPSNPDALGITFVRDAAPDLALLDRLEDPTAEGAERGRSVPAANGRGTKTIPAVNGRGTNVGDESPESAAPEQTVSARLHEAARAVLAGCGCAVCAAAMAVLAADDSAEDETAAGESADDEPAEVERGAGMASGRAETSRLREATLARALGASLRVSAVRLERLDAGLRELGESMRDALRDGLREAADQMSGQVRQAATATEERIEQRVGEQMERVEQAVATDLTRTAGELRGRLERLEAQPMPGGPAARAAEKSHALHGPATGPAGQPSAAEQYRALEALAGRLADPQAQIAVAAELIRLQRGASGF